jgi:hypothetical protein
MPRKSAAELEVECLRLLAMDPHTRGIKRLVGGKQSLKRAQAGMPVCALNKDRALHRGLARFGSRISRDCSIAQPILRVRNESICYEVFIDRTKPDNSVRINPATRHSETKYGFVILTGDMIFKHFFVGVKLLLRHEHLSSAAANSHQNQLTCHASKTKLRGG